MSPGKIAIPRPRFFPRFSPRFLNFFAALHVHTVYCSVDRCEPLTSQTGQVESLRVGHALPSIHMAHDGLPGHCGAPVALKAPCSALDCKLAAYQQYSPHIYRKFTANYTIFTRKLHRKFWDFSAIFPGDSTCHDTT